MPAAMKLVGTISGTGAALVGLIVAIPAAWSMLELPEIASRGFVRETVKPIVLVQTTTTTAVDRLVLIQLKQSLYDAQKDPAAQTSPIIRDRIQEIQIEIERTEARVRASGQGR